MKTQSNWHQRFVRKIYDRTRRTLTGGSKEPLKRIASSEYWSGHTVHVSNQDFLVSREKSLDYFHWRCNQYSGYLEAMPVSGLDGLDVLDYGCGPAHDLVGIATYSKPRSLTGIDVSPKALAIASERLKLHDADNVVSLLHQTDEVINLPSGSMDYIHTSGVLHHVPNEIAVLKEFHRILRHGGRVRIMIYNRESLWWHLYVPWYLQVKKRVINRKVSIDVAFRMSTDGFNCPISQAYSSKEFLKLAHTAGFEGQQVGNSISLTEVQIWRKYAKRAITDNRLSDEHRDFLRQVTDDYDAMPIWQGRRPGIGLMVELYKV